MHISDAQRDIVKRILVDLVPDYEVWAFGSRVHLKNLKPYSDLDLAIITQTKLDSKIYGSLKEAFSESDLPFRVDVLDWSQTDDNFRKVILQNYEIIQTPP